MSTENSENKNKEPWSTYLKFSLIHYYLLTRGRFIVWYNFLLRYVLDTKSIEAIDGQKPFSVFPRYAFIRGLQYAINSLVWLRNSFDLHTKKIQIVKNYDEGEKTMIVDADKLERDYITISDVIDHVDHRGKLDNVGRKPIFLKFELHAPNMDPTCLKEFIIRYNDHHGHHHHTLANILNFNKIDVPMEDAKIKIIKLDRGKRNILELSYNDVHDSHISYFFDLDRAKLEGGSKSTE